MTYYPKNVPERIEKRSDWPNQNAAFFINKRIIKNLKHMDITTIAKTAVQFVVVLQL